MWNWSWILNLKTVLNNRAFKVRAQSSNPAKGMQATFKMVGLSTERLENGKGISLAWSSVGSECYVIRWSVMPGVFAMILQQYFGCLVEWLKTC